MSYSCEVGDFICTASAERHKVERNRANEEEKTEKYAMK